MKQDHLISAVTIVIAMALPGAIVIAQSLPPQPGQTHAEQMGIPSSGHYMSFWELDTNKDRLITREEAAKSPAVTRRFNEIDTNGDGVLSRDEVSGWSFRGPALLRNSEAGTTSEASRRASSKD